MAIRAEADGVVLSLVAREVGGDREVDLSEISRSLVLSGSYSVDSSAVYAWVSEYAGMIADVFWNEVAR